MQIVQGYGSNSVGTDSSCHQSCHGLCMGGGHLHDGRHDQEEGHLS